LIYNVLAQIITKCITRERERERGGYIVRERERLLGVSMVRQREIVREQDDTDIYIYIGTEI
jgi:hypothetical protein